MEFNTHSILIAFGLTLFAGLSTGIGSLIAWTCKRTNTRFLSVALGFSAGVMIYVSFVEILAEARNLLTETLGHTSGSWVAIAGFFGGIFVIALIDRLVPAADNPHEPEWSLPVYHLITGRFLPGTGVSTGSLVENYQSL